jgi:hypothetical protein
LYFNKFIVKKSHPIAVLCSTCLVVKDEVCIDLDAGSL